MRDSYNSKCSKRLALIFGIIGTKHYLNKMIEFNTHLNVNLTPV